MQCKRLINLIKNWYLQIQDETMAPARMVAFMAQHIGECEECLADPDVAREVERVKDIVLPPSKVPKPKVVKPFPDESSEEATPDEEETQPEDVYVDDDEVDEDEEDDEDEDDEV